MLKGVVKFYKSDKGYGFIDLNGEDLFFHIKSVLTPGVNSLQKGDKVSFVLSDGKKGKVADRINVENDLRPIY